MPRRDSIIALLVEADERARINSIVNVLTFAAAIPFGYLAGWLSDTDRRLPFALDIVFFVLAFIVVCAGGRLMARNEA
jgi:hypothetical protein